MMLPANQRLIAGASGQAAKLNVHVVFTGAKQSQAALRAASNLARDLDGRVTVVVPRVVPYPLPLDQPGVRLHWIEQSVLRATVLDADTPEVETAIEVRLCRDPVPAVRDALRTNSIVVVGGHKRWWRTKEQKLAERLRLDGHHVIFIDAA